MQGISGSFARKQPLDLSRENSLPTVRAALCRLWGYPDFRYPQGEIVQALLAGQDCLVVLPTGGGKSICFQLPALLSQGLTLVVSPLVALMENQVQELQAKQLPAAVLHSQLDRPTRSRVLADLAQNRLRLLYLSPETLLSPPVWQQLCQPHLPVAALIVDEAHCLTQWGESFRPTYYRLGAVRSALLAHKPPGSQMAIAAFTATADPETQRVLTQVLGLRSPQRFCVSPYRANLSLQVKTVWTPDQRQRSLLRFLQSQLLQSQRLHTQDGAVGRGRASQAHGPTGLIYVRSRKDSEDLAHWLRQKGWQTAAYHAGLSASARRHLEAQWLSGALPFVVCTCAFGMGINKPDVRWVLHYQLPLYLSEYVQEVGRAGRDGQLATALALVSEPTGWLDPSDRQRQQFFVQRLDQQQRLARSLRSQLPLTGHLPTLVQDYPEAELALAILQRQGQVTWQDPFHYQLQSTGHLRQGGWEARTAGFPPALPENAVHSAAKVDCQTVAQPMRAFLTSRKCRWQGILLAFGFAAEAAKTHCGHCDRCRQNKG